MNTLLFFLCRKGVSVHLSNKHITVLLQTDYMWQYKLYHSIVNSILNFFLYIKIYLFVQKSKNNNIL